MSALERSPHDRVFSGVAGGMAEYFSVSPGFVRFLFVLAAIFSGGIFILVYIGLIFVLPMGTGQVGVAAPGVATRPPLEPAEEAARAARRREGVGYLLLLLGVIFLLGNLGFFRFFEWRYLWPLALIAIGAFLVIERARR